MSEGIQLPSFMDPTVAKIRFKIGRFQIDYGIQKYDEECIDMILDYVVIYMKHVLRGMAEYKRKYDVTSLLRFEEEDGEENVEVDENMEVDEDEDPEVVEEEDKKRYKKGRKRGRKKGRKKVTKKVYQKDKPKATKYLEEKAEENKEGIATDDKEGKEAEDKAGKEAEDKEGKETEDKEGKETEDKEGKTTEDRKKDPVISELIYSGEVFSLVDFVKFLRENHCIIPRRSIYEVILSYSSSKLSQKTSAECTGNPHFQLCN